MIELFKGDMKGIEGGCQKEVLTDTVEAERKNFKLLFSAGIVLAVEVSILYFQPMMMV